MNTRQLSFSFPELRYSPLEINPERIANIWYTERDKVSTIKFEAVQILNGHFRRPSLVLKLPSNLMHLTARKEFNLSTSKFPSVLMSALVTTMF